MRAHSHGNRSRMTCAAHPDGLALHTKQFVTPLKVRNDVGRLLNGTFHYKTFGCAISVPYASSRYELKCFFSTPH